MSMKIDYSKKLKSISNKFFYLWLLTLVVFFGLVLIENTIVPGEPFSNKISEYILLGVMVLGVVAFLAVIFFGALSSLSKYFSRKSKPSESVTKKTGNSKTSLYGKFEEELSDVIFVPQKNKYGVKHLLVGSLVIIIAVVVIVGWPSNETPLPAQENSSTPTNLIPRLIIEDIDSKWVNQNLYITGVIRNNNNQPVFNIIVRVDFFSDKENKNLFDTRIFTIEGMAPKSAFTFEKPANIRPKYNQWWYALTVIDAE